MFSFEFLNLVPLFITHVLIITMLTYVDIKHHILSKLVHLYIVIVKYVTCSV